MSCGLNNIREAPTCMDVTAKASLEILGLIVLIFPMAYVYVISSEYTPYQRGFFCDDENLKHPYLPETVPIVACVIIWAVVSVTLIVLVESLRSYTMQHTRRHKPILNNRTPWVLVELYRHFGFFSLGALTTLLFTELAKYTVGRLRPFYLTACGVKLTPELCHDEFGYEKFVIVKDDEMCDNLINGEFTKKQLIDARLSFLSGHSSFSFYCGMFLIIYLQARLNNMPRANNKCVRLVLRVLKVMRPFLQFGMIILSLWISLTRISDYRHHPLDVIFGALVGMTFATVTLVVIGDVFTRRSAFWKTYSEEKTQQTDQMSNPLRPMLRSDNQNV